MPVLRPYTFIDRITEVGGFFRKDGLVTLAALILGKTPLAVLDDTRMLFMEMSVYCISSR